jgi:hypothetical protein
MIGLDASEARAAVLLQQALEALQEIPGDIAPLAGPAALMIQRDH